MIFAIPFWILFSLGVAQYARSRGHGFGTTLIYALLFSPVLTLMVVLLIAPNEDQIERQRIGAARTKMCPHCAELIKIQATACRYCGNEVPLYITQTAPRKDQPESLGLLFRLSFLLTILGAVIIFALFVSQGAFDGTPQQTTTQTDSAAPAISPEPIVAPPETSPAVSSPAASDTPAPPPSFGGNWVMVNGQRISGITKVLPVSGGQVTIISSYGGQNVAATDLPEGFLEEWNARN
jgi:hypothetical protein